MDNNLQINQNAEQTYHSIHQSIVSAQHKLSAAVNYAMVITYWEIGKQIYKACGENDRAAYGKNLLDYLSAQLTAEFGKGFDKSNLRKMRQFYCAFPIRDTLCLECFLGCLQSVPCSCLQSALCQTFLPGLYSLTVLEKVRNFGKNR